ncbi:helix-turn-helix family protein [Mycobacteroides abscessus 1948]|uniref:Helix-turn-helix family protein n=1 Tax=Mycobacteroides abscessus 1948 TaxID=1299323 RepID=A0A829QH32_9MYCO|nr:helix-turn-helix family protein [Mycobacteroides abscessus 1948]
MDMALLLREAIGDTLRSARSGQGKTLREVSDSARVSLGYLSEVERGRKEASSELLAAICGALDVPLSQVLSEVSERLARREAPVAASEAALASTARVTQRDRRGHQGRHSAGSRNGGRLTTVAVALFRAR